MSEDEAFIRAIVDSPGDDTPRLVYADWLDDRDDPRGTYLRAEREWAKRRRKAFWKPPETKPELKAVETLRQQAAAFDPFWVARVSRPPIGVCCDNLVFTESGKRLSEQDISEFEKQTKGVIPLQLRAFLMNYNGGRPRVTVLPPRTEREKRLDRGMTVEMDCFLPLCNRARRRDEKLCWVYVPGENGPEEYGRQLLIGRWGEDHSDDVWLFDEVDEARVVRDWASTYHSYGSLPTFLSLIGHREPENLNR